MTVAARRSARWPRPASAQLAGARFVAVLSRDEGVLPAVAALEPAQAVAHLTLADTGPVVTRAADANRFLERLQASQVDPYLLKAGRVGGTDPAASLEIKEEHAAAILNGCSPAPSSGSGIPTSATGWPPRCPASTAATGSCSFPASSTRAPAGRTSTPRWFQS